MVSISIKTDFKNIQKQLNSLSLDVQKKVVPAALNKVVAKASNEMATQISREFNIKRDDVKKRLQTNRAGRSLDRWFASLNPFASARRGRSLNLIRFLEKSVSLAEGRRRKKQNTLKQLRFEILRGKGKKIITGAFIGNKGRTVFVREGNSRLPIKALSTIDVPQMFNTRRIQDRVIDRINKELEVEFERAINAVVTGRIR